MSEGWTATTVMWPATGRVEYHVLPVNDLRQHEDDVTCWCHPRVEEDDGIVVIHNSLDQRESYEEGRLFS